MFVFLIKIHHASKCSGTLYVRWQRPSLLWALWQFRELRGHTPLEEQFAAATPALICTGLSMTFVFSLLFVARALGGRAQIDPALLPGISPTRMARRVRHVEACGGIEFEGAVPQRAKGK